MATSDFITIILYLGGIFILGAAFTRRAHENTTSYFLSSRKLPWWIAGTSMVATSFSCDTPLYVTRLVRSGGVSLNWQWWSFAIGGLLSAFLLARLWRRAEVVTDVELTELRYGSGAGSVLRVVRAGWMALAINTISMSWVILAMAKIIGVVWGGPKWAGVLGATALAVGYSFMAGFWGVVVTDVAQFVIALFGAIALAFFSVKAAGGMGPILAAAGPERLSIIPHLPEGGLFSGEFWTGAFGGFVIYASFQWWANINSDGGGKVIQRMSATKNEAHAFGATLWFNIAHYALRTWPWVIAALASLVLFPNLADDELAYPKLILEHLPSPWTGILVAGLVAAFMSTIDTQLNWGSSYLTHDLYRRWINPNRGEKHYLIAAKVSMLLLIGITAVISYYITSVTEAFKFLIAFGAGVGPVYILRWFWWRINAWSELAAMVVSFAVALWFQFGHERAGFTPLPAHLQLVVGVIITTLGWMTVTMVTRPARTETLQAFYDHIRPMGPGWKGAGISLADADPSESPTAAFLAWFLGCLTIYSALFGTGYLLYGSTATGAACLAVTAGAAWGVLKVLPRVGLR